MEVTVRMMKWMRHLTMMTLMTRFELMMSDDLMREALDGLRMIIAGEEVPPPDNYFPQENEGINWALVR